MEHLKLVEILSFRNNTIIQLVIANPFSSSDAIQVYSDAKPFNIVAGGETPPGITPEIITSVPDGQGGTALEHIFPLTTSFSTVISTVETTTTKTTSSTVLAQTQSTALAGTPSDGSNVGKGVWIGLGTLVGIILLVILGWYWVRRGRIASASSGRLQSDGEIPPSTESPEKGEVAAAPANDRGVAETPGGRITTAANSHNFNDPASDA